MFGIGARIDTLLGQGAEFRGNVTVEGSVVVDGRLEGNVNATEEITVGRHGNVNGNLSAPEVVVGGKVLGNISASERVELLPGAQVNGDIRAPRLVTADGAQVSGSVAMEAAPLAAVEPKPELRLVKK